MIKYVAVADAFANQYTGGAELTTRAILQRKNSEVLRVNSHTLTDQFIEDNKDKSWFIFNFSNVEEKMLVKIAKTVKYSIVEYDYKFCKHRSPELHQLKEGRLCDCMDQGISSKIKLLFYGYAKKVWFMSDVQRKIFLNHVKSLKPEKTEVLSSVFLDGDLYFMNSISGNKKNSKYLILNSNSWIKGTSQCIEYAKSNGIDYELVSGLDYHELLIKMSTSKGLIFRPLGGDTCPRIVIEAKLLGCDILMNDNVQHKFEDWFSTKESCEQYLKTRVDTFWRSYE
jgi:hypothetical protein